MGPPVSRDWISEMRGSVHQNFSYIIIPNSNGDHVVMYPEAPITEQNESYNSLSHQIHVVSEDIDCTCILSNSLFQDEEKNIRCWALEFDGAHSSAGSGAGIVLISPDKGVTCFSYRLEFDCTNNISKYEALILGLNLTIDMNIRSLHVRGDSDLIISQVKRNFSTKKPRLRKYRMLFGML
jgi:hypothetical protein